jgi:hypothetical protein
MQGDSNGQGVSGRFGCGSESKNDESPCGQAGALHAGRMIPRLALVAALLSAACAGCKSDHKDAVRPAESKPRVTSDRGPKPVVVSLRRLRKLSARSRYPIYWAGDKKGVKYELSRAGSYTFIRYLPLRVHAGDRSTKFLTIGSYPRPNAFSSLRQTVSRNRRYVAVHLSRGGLAIYANDRPTLMYLAYPRSRVQVAIFHPSARVARDLVVHGRIRRIE